MFFWVFPLRQYVICRRFGTMYQFYLQRLEVDFEDGTDTWFRNVGILHTDAAEIPKRTYTIFRSRRKLEIYKITDNLHEDLCAFMIALRGESVVCFLLGNSPTSEFYMPTYGNTLSFPSS